MLRVIEEQKALAGADFEYVVEMITRVRLEDWQGALEALGDRFTPPSALFLTPAAFDFARALIHARLGQEEAARECHARGAAAAKPLFGADPARWERSDVMRWRRQAEAALGM